MRLTLFLFIVTTLCLLIILFKISFLKKENKKNIPIFFVKGLKKFLCLLETNVADLKQDHILVEAVVTL